MDIAYRTDSSFGPVFSRSYGTAPGKVDNAHRNNCMVRFRNNVDVAKRIGFFKLIRYSNQLVIPAKAGIQDKNVRPKGRILN